MKVKLVIGWIVLLLAVGCVGNETMPTKISAISTPTLTSTVPPIVTPTLVAAATDTATVPPTIVSITDTPILPTVTLTPLPVVVQADGAQNIVIDQSSLQLFDSIPAEYIQRAAKLRVMYRHASVGVNIDQGLNCLMNNFADRRPNSCTAFFDPQYDRRQWSFQVRGNNGWMEKVDDFVTQTNAQIDQFDVFTFTFGYVDAQDESSYPKISDPEIFQKQFVDKVEALEAQHPDKIFIWWTIPLARQGFANLDQVNEMIRAYAREHHKILMDAADIETYTLAGEKSFSPEGYSVISAEYTDESRAGHLNKVGRERLARSFWVLMARVAGWSGNSE